MFTALCNITILADINNLFFFENLYMKNIYLIILCLVIGFICCFDMLDSYKKINGIIKQSIIQIKTQK